MRSCESCEETTSFTDLFFLDIMRGPADDIDQISHHISRYDQSLQILEYRQVWF